MRKSTSGVLGSRIAISLAMAVMFVFFAYFASAATCPVNATGGWNWTKREWVTVKKLIY